MGKAVEQLLAYRQSDEGYTVPFEDVRALQVEAMNERLQERIDRIKLVRLRADDAGLSEIVLQPEFAKLRDDPRWLLFLHKLGKSPEQLAAIKFDLLFPQTGATIP